MSQAARINVSQAGIQNVDMSPDDAAGITAPSTSRDLLEERAAIREYDGGYTREEAERLAWGELQNRWHREHGERVPRDLCGCRRPIGSADVLDLIDGNRVHLRGHGDCLGRHGERWRLVATRALVALELYPPRQAIING